MSRNKITYKYGSPASAGLGLAVSETISMLFPEVKYAGHIGTMAAGALGGFNLTDEEMNIKAKFDEA